MVWLNPHPILFETSIGSIYAHGVLFAIGAEISTLLLFNFLKRLKIDTSWCFELVLAVFFAGLLGARIGYFISYPNQYISPLQLFAIWEGGLVSYFGILTGIWVAYKLISKKYKKISERYRYLDCLVVATCFGWAIGRIGNYYAGESFGIQSSFFQSFYGRVPIQLFEALSTLLIGIIGKFYLLNKNLIPGALTFIILASYSFLRFIIDIWRDEILIHGLHVSQYVSLVLLIISLIGHHFIYAQNRHNVFTSK